MILRYGRQFGPIQPADYVFISSVYRAPMLVFALSLCRIHNTPRRSPKPGLTRCCPRSERPPVPLRRLLSRHPRCCIHEALTIDPKLSISFALPQSNTLCHLPEYRPVASPTALAVLR